MKLAPIADRIAKIRRATDMDADALRDLCDLHSDQELDTFQLDMLVEMVCVRLDAVRSRIPH